MRKIANQFALRAGFVASFLSLCLLVHGQIAYEFPGQKGLGIGSYGRMGVDWSFENGGTMGRRLNLNNMGSQGGRLEEQDYAELAMGARLSHDTVSNMVYVQSRLSVYSTSLSLLGNSTTTSPGGLTFALPELFVEAKNIGNSGVNLWVGARLYRGPDVHIADYRYFNDHSGQGLGIEYKNTRFVGLFVASTDTSSTLPPYFYLNIATGTPSAEMRHRTVWALEHDFELSSTNKLTLLAEAHKLGNGGYDDEDDAASKYNYPSDFGFLLGARLETSFGKEGKSFNRFAARYGKGIANGGDGGSTKSWLTFGAPDTIALNYRKAYSINIVNDLFCKIDERNSMEAYVIYAQSKGGAETNGMAPTYYGREVYNRKKEFAFGVREMYQPFRYWRFLFEAHYAQRQDGENEFAKMTKLSFAPVLVPTASNDFWARPEIRFVTSVAFYNDFAKDNLYSPYLQLVGPEKVGYYFGIKVEWWLWG